MRGKLREEMIKINSRERKRKEERYLKRQADKLKDSGTAAAINILQVLPCYILGTEYGFGNLRLERFLTRLYDLSAQAAKEPRLMDIMREELEHDKGIRISFEKDDILAQNVWKDGKE